MSKLQARISSWDVGPRFVVKFCVAREEDFVDGSGLLPQRFANRGSGPSCVGHMVMTDDGVPQSFSFWFLGKLNAMLQVGEDRFKSRIVLVK
jgi:hypothetical protein